MTSPFVTKLVAELNRTVDPEAKAILRAELGCYWARVGEFDEVERLRQDLRREFGDARSARVSILIMVMEALQLYYKELSPGARDRMLRANLLSKGFREPALIARTSAWMAHMELNSARFDAMISELRTTLESMQPGDDGTECRVSLVFGDACLIAGLPLESQAWYERARRAANRLGDHAAVGAMTYNRAALRVARCRYERLMARDGSIDTSLLRLDVESAINYQSVARLRSLDHLLKTTKVGLLLIQENCLEAIPYIEDLLTSTEVAQDSAQRLLLMADYSFALASTGMINEAVNRLNTVLEKLTRSVPTDDHCLILASLRSAASLCNIEEMRIDLGHRLHEALAKHESITEELRGKLLAFDVPVLNSGRANARRTD